MKSKTPIKGIKHSGFTKKASFTGSHFTTGIVSTATIRHKTALRENKERMPGRAPGVDLAATYHGHERFKGGAAALREQEALEKKL